MGPAAAVATNEEKSQEIRTNEGGPARGGQVDLPPSRRVTRWSWARHRTSPGRRVPNRGRCEAWALIDRVIRATAQLRLKSRAPGSRGLVAGDVDVVGVSSTTSAPMCCRRPRGRRPGRCRSPSGGPSSGVAAAQVDDDRDEPARRLSAMVCATSKLSGADQLEGRSRPAHQLQPARRPRPADRGPRRRARRPRTSRRRRRAMSPCFLRPAFFWSPSFGAPLAFACLDADGEAGAKTDTAKRGRTP